VINYYFNVPLTPPIGHFFVWISIIVFCILIFKQHQKLKFFSRFGNFNRLEKILASFLALIIFAPWVMSFRMPVTSWDAVTLFDYRAKIILDTGSIKETLTRASIIDYPLFTTLAHWWIYTTGLSTPMPLYPVIFSSFLIICFGLFRRITGRTPALLGTLILAFSPKLFDQSLVAYSNMPYSVYLILGASYIYFWTKHKQFTDLLLGILFSLTSLWIRGFPFLLVQICLIIVNLRIPKKTIYLAIFLLLLLSAKITLPLNITLLLGIIDFLKWSIFQYYIYYWLLFGLTLIYWYKTTRREIYWPLLISGYLALLFLGTYVYALRDPNYAEIPDAIQRTAMFINPAIVWFALTVLYEDSSKNNIFS
jgi:hypothetical protein